MLFTSLHRHLGEPPGPITEAMLDDAVTRRLPETTDLDWKSELPDRSGLVQSDFPKDVAAMANSGGGTLVYGVRDVEKRASDRTDAGAVDEKYERSLHAVAYTAIAPPVLGLRVETIVTEGQRAYAVVVPDSPDAPHLVYKNQFFGAPVRTDSDTAWMRERDVEAAYRARFAAAADAESELNRMYEECLRAHDPHRGVQFIAVARPRHAQLRLPQPPSVLPRAIEASYDLADKWLQGDLRRRLGHPMSHAFDALDFHRPRKGFRRWAAVAEWSEERLLDGHAAVHDSGAVTLGWLAGGKRLPRKLEDLPGHEITSRDLEVFVGDFMALVKSVADDGQAGDVDVRIGVEWDGQPSVACWEVNDYRHAALPAHAFGERFTPIRATISTLAGDAEYFEGARALALDCASQFGLTTLGVFASPPTAA